MDGEWQFESGECVLRCEHGRIRLRALDPSQAPQPTHAAELAPIALREWAEYRIVIKSDRAAPWTVWVNRQQVARDPDGPFWPFAFKNQIGKSTIRVVAAGVPLPPLTVEVLSAKFPTPLAHLRFYQALLDDLTRRSVRLPFTFEAPTTHAVEEVAQPPSALFVYHFLRQHGVALQAALETILRAPHRLLRGEGTIVPLACAQTVNAEVVGWVLSHPEAWSRAPHLAIARRLGGYAPTRVFQRLADETFDTPANRFARHFVHELAQWLTHPLLAPLSARLDPVPGVIETALRAPLFEHVGEMHRFPSESQVLLRRDGYRELLGLWRLYQMARRPFFGPLQEAIDSRDVATLYEFWCFFTLAERLQAGLGPAVFELSISDPQGLQHRAQVRFEQDPHRLIYNVGFRRREDRTGSYSVGLRPDFALVLGRKADLVFDAKFRFDAKDLAAAEDTYEEDVAEGEMTRVVKRADLYKMHTYRDALRARAAIALYPGDEAVFYDAGMHIETAVDLDTLLDPAGPAGVGALPLSPA